MSNTLPATWVQVFRAGAMADLPALMAFIDAACDALTADGDVRFAVRLAVEEVFTNILEHGYAGDGPVAVAVDGGHEAPVLVGAAGVRARLAPTGAAVGMLPGMAYTIAHATIAPGETLLLFTDGATDARDPAGALFGEEFLLSLLTPGTNATHARPPPPARPRSRCAARSAACRSPRPPPAPAAAPPHPPLRSQPAACPRPASRRALEFF